MTLESKSRQERQDVFDSPVWALAVLETMERDGKAERIGTSFLNPRNYIWRLVN